MPTKFVNFYTQPKRKQWQLSSQKIKISISVQRVGNEEINMLPQTAVMHAPKQATSERTANGKNCEHPTGSGSGQHISEMRPKYAENKEMFTLGS